MVTIEEFRNIDLRTGVVVAAERVPQSQKLMRLTVNLGSETRQIMAGIAGHYSPQTLVGKTVIAVVNLEPKILVGFESQGMLLAATSSDGNVVLLTADQPVAPGSKIT